MRDMQELIAAWMNDEATAEQAQILFEWIREDPAHARQFATETALHSDLKTYFSTARSLQQVGEKPFAVEPVDTPVVRPSYRRQWQISAAIAACVLLVVSGGLLLVHVDNNGPGEGTGGVVEAGGSARPFVTVAQLENAEWDRSSAPEPGDRLSAETLILRSGMARLLFDDGVEVTLQGPARYRLIAKGSTDLHSGVLPQRGITNVSLN